MPEQKLERCDSIKNLLGEESNSNDCNEDEKVSNQRKVLKRIIKPFSEDSDEEDIFHQPEFTASELNSNNNDNSPTTKINEEEANKKHCDVENLCSTDTGMYVFNLSYKLTNVQIKIFKQDIF